VGSNVVKNKAEDIMLDEEGVAQRLEHKVLHEGLSGVLVRLELPHHVDQDSPVEHRVAVNGGDIVTNFLECEAVDLLHDLGSALHLLTLEAQKALLRIIKLCQLSPCSVVVEHCIILLDEGLSNLVEVGIEGHFNLKGRGPTSYDRFSATPVTLDIIGMYTNVPYEEGLQAFAKLMEQRENKEVPTWFLVKLMKFVAESSIFVFDTELFLQLLGVAMGSKSSPTFACLFVGILEGVMMRAWQMRGGSLPHMLKRFIDDIFFLWRDGEEHLKQFIAHLNGFHRTIKFEVTQGESYNFQTRAISFLDLKIWIDEKGFIQTTLFQKPCRVVSYLLPSSSHPGFITRNIPYSLAYRLVRIESTQEGLEQNLNKLQEELVGRGYRHAVVQAAMDRARQMSRATALVKVQKAANKRPVFCMPYDPRLPPVTGILKKRHTALLARDVDAREYFPQPPLVTFTRSKNIRDIIFRAKVPRISRRGGLRPSRPPGFFKCRRRTNCTLCLHSEDATSYTCPFTGAVAKITQHITCQNSGVYLLLCRKTTAACARVKPLYVGICAAESSFTHRMAGHVGTATQPCQEETMKSVGAHFRLQGHLPHRDMQMLPIEVISGNQPFLLQVREAYNIEKFGTEKRLGVREIEHGLNLSPGML